MKVERLPTHNIRHKKTAYIVVVTSKLKNDTTHNLYWTFHFDNCTIFVKKDLVIKHKKWLIYGNIISLIILAVDIFLITKFNTSYKTIWVDRLFVVGFLIIGAMTFSLYTFRKYRVGKGDDSKFNSISLNDEKGKRFTCLQDLRIKVL